VQPLIVARAPGHIALGVSNTRFPASAETGEHPAITAAINYCAYVIVAPSRATDVQITVAANNDLMWRRLRDECAQPSESRLLEAIARLFGVGGGMSISVSAQAPLGLGLGLSSSQAVAMIKALAFSCGLDLGPEEVAALACHVRVDVLNLQSYDKCHYAAACGGINAISSSGKTVKVHPLKLSLETQQSLERHLMLFGAPRAEDQARGDAEVGRLLLEPESQPLPAALPHSLHGINRAVRTSLEEGDWSALGELLQHAWLEQCRLAKVGPDDELISALDAARDSGAFGGQGTKLGSGLLIVLSPEERRLRVAQALGTRGLRQLPLALELEGVQVMEAFPRTKPTSMEYPSDAPRMGSSRLGFQ
jgi:galactokinase/mevalonate kinase-like predicted kinase